MVCRDCGAKTPLQSRLLCDVCRGEARHGVVSRISDEQMLLLADGSTTSEIAARAELAPSAVLLRLRRLESRAMVKSTGKARRGNPVRWTVRP